MIGPVNVVGMGICVRLEGEKATLITTVLNPNVLPNTVTKVEVAIPDSNRRLVAEYKSTDPETGITFVEVTDPFKWQPVTFTNKPDLGVGRQVFSLGLLDAWLGSEPYLGTAFVSGRVRVPGPMIYCAGGQLTNIGSPVFTADGTAVGIILQQLPVEVTLQGQGGQGKVLLSSQRENACFVPSDEFGAVINGPMPIKGKRLPWIGVLRFEPHPEAVVPLGVPAIRAVKVAPNTATLSSPAAKNGLKHNDTITGMNGQALEKLATPELTVQNFIRQLNRIPVGKEIEMTVLEAANPRKVKLTVESFPLTPREAPKYVNKDLGLVVREKVPLDQALDTSPTGKDTEKGLYVVAVGPDSPAAKAGLKGEPEFNLIVNVDMKPATNVKEFAAAVEALLANKKPINLVKQTGSQRENVTIVPK
jgi:S1-C subfamily serine protease